MTEREGYIALNMVDGIGPVRVRALLDVFGSIPALLDASPADWTEAKGIGPSLAEKIHPKLQQVDVAAEEKRAGKVGARMITRVDPDYPKALTEIHDPPLVLYVRGTLEPGDLHSIAVIGSRRCTHYGTQSADRLSFQLAKQGYTVVSGLARGIDAAAHQGALKGGGRTIAVMGTGIDQVYPTEHESLASRIIENGAVITEFPVGFKPTRQSFPQRNRIVSGLSKAILVVEAARGSGAMMTVDFATEQGRSVMAVPGRIDNPSAGGCHDLIKSGAKLVSDVDDITEEFEFLLPPKPEGREDPVHAKPQVQLSDPEATILGSLGREDITQDEVIRQTGLSAAEVATAILMLEMKRQIQSLPGRKIRRIF